jgi:hypothetical protein
MAPNEKSEYTMSSTVSPADPWSFILRPSSQSPPLGRALAQAPDAVARTGRLVENLDVTGLVVMADAQHNQCRLSRLGPQVGDDPRRLAEAAWNALEHGMHKRYGGESGWTGAIALLTPGASDGVAKVRQLPIERIIAVCTRIVSGPYQWANAARRGGTAIPRESTSSSLRPASATIPDPNVGFRGQIAAPAESDDLIGQLERLAALRRDGALNETEFNALKARLLSK